MRMVLIVPIEALSPT